MVNSQSEVSFRIMYRDLGLALAALAFSTAAFAQSLTNSLTPPSDFFQISYAANLNVGDSVLNITNSGATTTPVAIGGQTNGPTDPGTSQNLCANLYTFDPQEELISCCSCSVTPGGLQAVSVVNGLISNPLTPAIPTAVVIEMVSTLQTGTCDAGTPGTPAHGLIAWGTSLHQNNSTAAVTYAPTGSPYSQAALSAAEYTQIVSYCGFLQADGTGFGLCKGCFAGGLGATSVQ